MKDPIAITSEKTIDEAVSIMRARRVDTLFITNVKGKLVGYIDIEDLNEGYRKNQTLSILCIEIFIQLRQVRCFKTLFVQF